MSQTINSVVLAGRVTQWPTPRPAGANPDGTPREVVGIALACTETYRDADGVQRDRPMFIDCDAWGNNVPVAKQIVKGELIAIEGRLQLDTFVNNAGVEVRKHTILVQRITFMNTRAEKQALQQKHGANPALRGQPQTQTAPAQPQYQQQPQYQPQMQYSGHAPVSNEDIPF